MHFQICIAANWGGEVGVTLQREAEMTHAPGMICRSNILCFSHGTNRVAARHGQKLWVTFATEIVQGPRDSNA